MSQRFTRTIVSGNDLSNPNDLYKAVTLSGDFAANARETMGILVEGASSGRHVTLGVLGVIPYFSANVTSAGGALTVENSGEFTNAESGDWEIGMSYGEKGTNQVAVNCGATGEGGFNFFHKPFIGASDGVTI